MSFLLAICVSVAGSCLATYTEPMQTPAIERAADPIGRWYPLVASVFPESEVETAMCIIGHESAGEPGADNPRSSARGLFQVLGSMWAPRFGVSRSALYDPGTNTRIARAIWERQGWWAWSPYRRGLCRNR